MAQELGDNPLGLTLDELAEQDVARRVDEIARPRIEALYADYYDGLITPQNFEANVVLIVAGAEFRVADEAEQSRQALKSAGITVVRDETEE